MIARASALLLLAGLALGAAAPRATRTSPPVVDGFTMLEGDFHVHAFPGDGALTPRRLRDFAADEGLDVLAITNHNQILASHLLPRDEGPIVLLGEEVTHPDFHLAAVGITNAVDWNQPAVRVIADVHAQGGVAIAAHPEREFWKGWDQAAMAAVDGVEVAHPVLLAEPETRGDFEAFFHRALAVNPDVARIGSSDYHVTRTPGECRTYLFARERSQAGVIDAIRSGRTVARCADGTLIGDPALVALVHAHERQPQPRTSVMATLSAVLVWAGMAGLALLSRV